MVIVDKEEQCDHSYSGTFSNQYYPNRKNGWGDHILKYSTYNENINDKCFEIDSNTGTIVLLKDIECIKFDIWWQGHAPWGYRFLRLYKNIRLDFDYEASQLIGLIIIFNIKIFKP